MMVKVMPRSTLSQNERGAGGRGARVYCRRDAHVSALAFALVTAPGRGRRPCGCGGRSSSWVRPGRRSPRSPSGADSQGASSRSRIFAAAWCSSTSGDLVRPLQGGDAAMERLYQKFRVQRLVVLAVSNDSGAPLGASARFVKGERVHLSGRPRSTAPRGEPLRNPCLAGPADHRPQGEHQLHRARAAEWDRPAATHALESLLRRE